MPLQKETRVVGRVAIPTATGRLPSGSVAEGVGAHEAETRRWAARLEQAGVDSDLPDAPRSRPALSDFLVRLRLEGVQRQAVRK